MDNNVHMLLDHDDLFDTTLLWESMTILAQHRKRGVQWSYYHVETRCNQCDENDREYTKDRFLNNMGVGAIGIRVDRVCSEGIEADKVVPCSHL